MRTSINFAIRDMHKNTVLSIALLFLSLPALGQQKINYVVLDGKKYQGDELKWAASHPAQSTAPYLDKGSWFVVPRAADTHFYVQCLLNGFPVTFLIDTGATKTAIGVRVAKNAGIRAGESVQMGTANGVGQAMETFGNQMQVGAFTLGDVPVVVSLNQANGDLALLGMDVLKRFRIFQGRDALQLQRIN